MQKEDAKDCKSDHGSAASMDKTVLKNISSDGSCSEKNFPDSDDSDSNKDAQFPITYNTECDCKCVNEAIPSSESEKMPCDSLGNDRKLVGDETYDEVRLGCESCASSITEADEEVAMLAKMLTKTADEDVCFDGVGSTSVANAHDNKSPAAFADGVASVITQPPPDVYQDYGKSTQKRRPQTRSSRSSSKHFVGKDVPHAAAPRAARQVLRQ